MRSATLFRRAAGCLLLTSLAACGSCAAAPASETISSQGPTDPDAFAYDAKAALDIQMGTPTKKDGITLWSLTYASPKGGRVPAELIAPDGPGPFAGIVLMHGAPGNHRPMVPEAETLARHGAVALLIDAPFARPDVPDEEQEPIHFSELDRQNQIQLIVDLRRGVDLLTARKDVDRTRLGYLGISYGGATGGLLAGVEHRIKAYALVVGDGGVVSHFTGSGGQGDVLQSLPADQVKRWRARMDPIEALRFVGRAAPSHLLFQNGRQDVFVPPASAQAYQEAGSQPKKILWYDAGHGLNEQAIRDRHAWLAEEIGIRKP
jgi:dienelactone hydrolase